MKQFLKLIFKRKSILGSSRDTGYRVYERYFDKVRSECAQPVFNRSVKIKPPYLRFLLNLKKGYYSKKGFKDLGYKEACSRGWDEFLWKGEPFGFHLQGAQKDGTTKDHSNDMIYLTEMLEHFAKSNEKLS